jgi:hypothetical protein
MHVKTSIYVKYTHLQLILLNGILLWIIKKTGKLAIAMSTTPFMISRPSHRHPLSGNNAGGLPLNNVNLSNSSDTIADLLLIRKINSCVSPASGGGDSKPILYV